MKINGPEDDMFEDWGNPVDNSDTSGNEPNEDD